MKTKTIKVDYKSSELFSVLHPVLAGKMNLARIKFLVFFLCALTKVQTVCFSSLANGFEIGSKSSSSLRRIQRFMASYVLDLDLIASFIFKMLPHLAPYHLALDRTNWMNGEFNINILVLSIMYDGVSFPILFTMLDKRGNSNTTERIALMERYINLFGKETIKALLADREFVGKDWIKYLNTKKITYYIRIRENFLITDPKTRKQIDVVRQFAHVGLNEFHITTRKYLICEQACYLTASRVINKHGKPELQVIISYSKPNQALNAYKERWQIETAFRALKSSGFNIEDSHLTDLDRFAKLLSIVMLAFAWAFVAGVYKNNNIQAIRILKHGYRAKSFVKYGLEEIQNVFLNPFCRAKFDIFKFLSCSYNNCYSAFLTPYHSCSLFLILYFLINEINSSLVR